MVGNAGCRSRDVGRTADWTQPFFLWVHSGFTAPSAEVCKRLPLITLWFHLTLRCPPSFSSSLSLYLSRPPLAHKHTQTEIVHLRRRTHTHITASRHTRPAHVLSHFCCGMKPSCSSFVCVCVGVCERERALIKINIPIEALHPPKCLCVISSLSTASTDLRGRAREGVCMSVCEGMKTSIFTGPFCQNPLLLSVIRPCTDGCFVHSV